MQLRCRERYTGLAAVLRPVGYMAGTVAGFSSPAAVLLYILRESRCPQTADSAGSSDPVDMNYSDTGQRNSPDLLVDSEVSALFGVELCGGIRQAVQETARRYIPLAADTDVQVAAEDICLTAAGRKYALPRAVAAGCTLWPTAASAVCCPDCIPDTEMAFLLPYQVKLISPVSGYIYFCPATRSRYRYCVSPAREQEQSFFQPAAWCIVSQHDIRDPLLVYMPVEQPEYTARSYPERTDYPVCSDC